MAKPNRTARDLLRAIGIGDFNATMVIQYMFIAPATTDPKSAPIILIVSHLQRMLNSMGANLAVTGYLDVPTANAFERVVGPNWERISWAQNVGAILDAKGVGFAASSAPPPRIDIPMSGLSGPLDFLPDVPGGILTYAVGGVLAWHFLRKRH